MMGNSSKNISPEEFARLDLSKYTLVDLREPDEALIGPLPGAVNIPFSRFDALADSIPKDKPVILFCHIGEASAQAVETLAARGFDAAQLTGGYLGYRRYLAAYGPPEADGDDGAEDVVADHAAAAKRLRPLYRPADRDLQMIVSPDAPDGDADAGRGHVGQRRVIFKGEGIVAEHRAFSEGAELPGIVFVPAVYSVHDRLRIPGRPAPLGPGPQRPRSPLP